MPQNKRIGTKMQALLRTIWIHKMAAETGWYTYACAIQWAPIIVTIIDTPSLVILPMMHHYARVNSLSFVTWCEKLCCEKLCEKVSKIYGFLAVSKRMTKSKEMITSWNAKELAAAANWLVQDWKFQGISPRENRILGWVRKYVDTMQISLFSYLNH